MEKKKGRRQKIDLACHPESAERTHVKEKKINQIANDQSSFVPEQILYTLLQMVYHHNRGNTLSPRDGQEVTTPA